MLKVIEIENVHVFAILIYAAVLYIYDTLCAITNAVITDLKRHLMVCQPLHIIDKLGQFMDNSTNR